MLCVTKMMLMLPPASLLSVRRRSRIWAWIVTSRSRCRLVRDENRGIARKGHRDHDALAHAAGHLMGIVTRAPLRVCNADAPERVPGRFPCGAPGEVPVLLHRLRDLVADRIERVQARHRLLKDHGDLVAADRAHLGLGECCWILNPTVSTPEENRPRHDPSGRLDEAHQAEAGDRLAGPRFANDGQGLASPEREIDTINRPNCPFLGIEQGFQSLDPENLVLPQADHPT